MEVTDDDFGELYAVQATNLINGESHISQFYCSNEQQQQVHRSDDAAVVDGRKENDAEMHCDEGNEVGVKISSESDDDDDDDDDDFDVFVNDEDFGAKNGGGDTKWCSEEMVENMEGEFDAGAVEGSLVEKNQIRVDVEGMEQSGGGERVSVVKNGSNLQCKYPRRNGSVFIGNQRAVSSWKAEREDVWYSQSRMSGFVPGWAGNGNNFWLPGYRTIVDVDIDTIEQKSWTYPGADAADYFNYGFDEESWKSYCHSLDQLRRQTLSQSRNQVNESLRFKLKNGAGAIKEIQSDEIVDAKLVQFQKIGQAIHVEDSNTERQPSTDARRPRLRDSDVIEITVQDPDEPSGSSNEELYSTLETQCNTSDKRSDTYKSEPEAEQPKDSNSYAMRKNTVEETFRGSSVSFDSKRSNESAAVSSHALQQYNGQGKDHRSELDIEPSEKANTSCGRNPGAIGTVDSSMKDVSCSDTTETNPCVAGIDLAFDDHGLSSRSPSYSNACSEASHDYHYHSKRNQDLGRSSPDSTKEKFQFANIDYQRSRRNKDDKIVSENDYSLRVRNSIEENLKHDGQRVWRHVELKGRRSQDEYIRNGVPDNNYGVDRSRARHHRKSGERCRRSLPDDEYWSGYRENESSPSYDRKSVENQFQVECKRDFDRRDQWGSRDGVDMYFRREWDEEQLSSDKRMRSRRNVTVRNDWHVEARECISRDEKPYFRNQNFMLKFSSSRDINYLEQQREFDDIDFDKRNRHGQPLRNRFLRSNPLGDRHREHVTSDIEHERRSWRSRREVGTYGRADEFFESSLDVDHPQYTVEDEYWSTQNYSSTHNFRNALLTYDERRPQNTFFGDDTDNPQAYQRYERHKNSISARKGSRHVYDHRVAYDREDAPMYLDEDDYSEKRRKVFLPNVMSRTEDTRFDGCSVNDLCNESMLDYFEGARSHKWHRVKRGFVHGGMTIHKQITRGRFGVKECGKSYSKMSRRANLEDNGPRCRYPVELRHTVRERKSTGIFPKAGIVPNSDADGRFREQFKRQQEQEGAFPDNIMEKKTRNIETRNIETSWENFPARNRADASELEEGQILTEKPRTEIVKSEKYGSEHLAQKDTLKGRSGHNQMSQNDSHEYNENRILETMAKMEKRRERFKEPVSVKRDIDSDPKPEDDKLVEMIESKGQRPARKRKWG